MFNLLLLYHQQFLLELSCQLWTEDGRINGNRRIMVGTSPKLNPFMVTTMPPPQPVPPEIQQQRAMSICKVRVFLL